MVQNYLRWEFQLQSPNTEQRDLKATESLKMLLQGSDFTVRKSIILVAVVATYIDAAGCSIKHKFLN